jgi:PHD finger-like domain-containing protein 5A
MTSRSLDLKACGKMPGATVGVLCEKCDGKCVVCDSFVNPDVKARICEECKSPNPVGKCVLCGAPGVAEAYYCTECCLFEKDRDGCPVIINLGVSKKDLYFDSKVKRTRR